MKKVINWRKATEEEIENGLDHPDNKGMIIESIEEVPDEIIEEPNN